MIEDDIADLMTEPPAGHNHGWKRNDFGGWSSLETGEETGRIHRPFTPKNYHGRSYGYDKMKCRCVECRAWKALRNADYRTRKSDQTIEEV